MRKRILFGVLIALLVIQVIRPQKNVSAEAPGSDDFIVRFGPPSPVAQVLRSACYDCHSNRTRYPWYAEVQPVGWWLANHVKEAKHTLNFSTFGTYPLKSQTRKLNAISEEITDRHMPMNSYTWIHREARLTDQQIRAVSEWMDDLHDKLAPAE